MRRFLAKDDSEIYYSNDYHGHPNYKIVYFLLLGLMFVTVIPELSNAIFGYEVIPHSNVVIFFIFFLSTVKALLVLFKFMHIQFEHRILLLFVVICVLLLCIMYILLFVDISKQMHSNYFFTDYYNAKNKDTDFKLDLKKIEEYIGH